MHQRQGARDKGPWWGRGDHLSVDEDGHGALVGEGGAGLADHVDVDVEPLDADKHEAGDKETCDGHYTISRNSSRGCIRGAALSPTGQLHCLICTPHKK